MCYGTALTFSSCISGTKHILNFFKETLFLVLVSWIRSLYFACINQSPSKYVVNFHVGSNNSHITTTSMGIRFGVMDEDESQWEVLWRALSGWTQAWSVLSPCCRNKEYTQLYKFRLAPLTFTNVYINTSNALYIGLKKDGNDASFRLSDDAWFPCKSTFAEWS